MANPNLNVRLAAILIAGISALYGCGERSERTEGAAVETELSKEAVDSGHDWTAWGGDAEHRKYSPLDQITKENVDRLEVAWVFDAGGAFDLDGSSGSSEMQTTPLKVGNLLVVASPTLKVFGLEPKTGEKLWEFDPGDSARKRQSRRRLRGFATWSGNGERRIFTTYDWKLMALDAETGAIIESFGSDGVVDLREGLGRNPKLLSVSARSPGIVYDDLLVMGSTVSENYPSAPGHIRAYDVQSGELRWIFHTIPQPGEFGYDTWPENAWQFIGGVNAWGGLSLDEERGLVFFGTGSPTFDFYGANRTGDNLFANSVVALNAATGAYVWHFQTVRHDLWDLDLPGPPILTTVERDGADMDVAVTTTKDGRVFVLNRETGEPVYPVEYRPAPSSTVPGETAAETQPWPVIPKVIARNSVTVDELTTRTPEAYADALKQFETLSSRGPFDPPSLEGTILYPDFDGAITYGSGAVDPGSGLAIFNIKEIAAIAKLVSNEGGSMETARTAYLQFCSSCHGRDMEGSGEMPALAGLAERADLSAIVQAITGGRGPMPAFGALFSEDTISALASYIHSGEDRPVTETSIVSSPEFLRFRFDGYKRFLDADGYPATKPPWGRLVALDLNSGEVLWNVPFGEHPELVAQGIKDTGSLNYGGGVTTAGGLYFIGASLYDNAMRAYDVTDGKLLWRADLPASAPSVPAVYLAGGRQYVVIAAGGGKRGAPAGSKYVAFALPGGERSFGNGRPRGADPGSTLDAESRF